MTVTQKNKKTRLIVIVAGIVAAAIIGGIVLSTSDLDSGKSSSGEPEIPLSNLVTKNTPLKGDPSAPVTLLEFGDFQCPNCGRFARETAPQIEEAYVQSGKVNMAFRHFTVIGPDSKTAAMASQCANDQGKFWEYHDVLYENQGLENSGWAKKDNLKNFATQIGLNRQIFDSCLDSEKYRNVVEDDLNLAIQIGFKGTPSFLIIKNDGSSPETLTGAYPYQTFEKILDERLDDFK